MNTLINIIISLFVFGFIIFVHEFGHFLLAKKNGIYVNEFAIGMGPTLFSFTRKETKYALNLIPMGGYCMMMGENEEVEDEHSFSAKSVWARISVVVAGPFFNFILAFLLSIVLISIIGYDAPVVSEFLEGSPAQEVGIEAGDEITHYNGNRIYNFREVMIYTQFNQTGEPITLTVERDGKNHDYTFSPEKIDGRYLMGIRPVGYIRTNVLDTLKYSALEVRFQIKSTFLSLKYLFTGKISFNSLSGPVGIVAMMSDTIDQAKEESQGDKGLALANIAINMLNFCILLSAGLGIMNLLPIPALDGGRTIFLLVEAISKKKLSADKEALVNTIGFVFLIGLMIVVMFQDVIKIIH